jgi:hypothetical protein
VQHPIELVGAVFVQLLLKLPRARHGGCTAADRQPAAVKTHIANLMSKTGATNRVRLAVLGLRVAQPDPG